MAAPARVRQGVRAPLASERGVFVLADISGYTGYVFHSPLEYAEDVLADITGTIADRLRHVLRVNKLEGDAVFAYAPGARADASMILDAIEECYFAVRARLEGVERATSCDCSACRKAAELDLKFVLHAGGYVRRRGPDGDELTGRDVIVAHRLLKNGVAEAFDLRGYALLTDGFADAFGLVPRALGMVPHVETYPDVGEVRASVLDLERRYREERERRRVAVGEDEAAFVVEQSLPVSPPAAWELLTAPDRRLLWQGNDVDEAQAGGRRSTGTSSVCVDGRTRIYEEILDWRPFDYFTESRTRAGGARFVLTTSLTPAGEGTAVRVLGRPDGGRPRPFAARRLARRIRADFDRLSELVAAAGEA